MIDYDPLEGFRDPETYDLEEEGYDEDYPLTEQWARELGGPRAMSFPRRWKPCSSTMGPKSARVTAIGSKGR
jgi:hypothetical protein